MYSRERSLEHRDHGTDPGIAQNPRRPFQRRRRRPPTDNPNYVALEHVCDQYLLHLERSKKSASWRTARHQLSSILNYFGPDADATLL